MSFPDSQASNRGPLLDWLVRLNNQVAGWAAQASWGRLVFLFLVVLVAFAILGSMLSLHHDKVKVPVPAKHGETVTVVVDGKTIRIGPDGIHAVKPPTQPGSPATPASAAPPDARPDANPNPNPNPRADDDDEDEKPDIRLVNRKVVTWRGVIGDLFSAALVLVFAYLVAAKIVVRKVAQADAKVQKAVDTAERETMERQLAQAKLQVLQAQVEPHFLFNTLAAVDYLIETDPARASQMQKQLITYLRGALPQMRQESSTLGREMRLIRSYLELIKMRVEERLEVSVDVPDGLESAEFPPMMLQSLVENAIKHGIEPKPEGGKVAVSAKVANGLLWVEVKDTGVGIDKIDGLDAPPKGTGIGLQNIRERLAVLYRGKARFTLVSDDGEGTTVRIGVPYKAAVEDEPAAEGKPA
ncbi:sensor histidine kinase [Ramlibacter albus]|uniref:histidine kinase n=1 Tax=Ramlibacter albus TaxID=2079448 RepID=A0A923S4P9_9BURK|nr:sensor histidine kinase [Ramlibacter albus]MBC5764347.1 sensor histidine kinase [Ramlibacter albus]